MAAEPDAAVNSIGMKLILVPSGEFMMGSRESIDELVHAYPDYKYIVEHVKDEFPQHRVRITRPFYLGKFEVTVGQFARFVKETGYKTQAESDGTGAWGYNPALGHCEGRKPQYSWRNPGFPQTDDHPVLNVTWNDAVAMCRWLSRKEGKTYRLPTEAQWEYACRAGTTTRYSNGDDPNRLAQIAKVTDAKGHASFPAVQNLEIPKDDSRAFTAPVGSFPPNAFGLCDMHGNAWEWCADWYDPDYYSRSPVDDPQGPESGKRRVRRGGAWNSFPLWPRSSFRNINTPESRCVNLGFRMAEDVAE
jgi:formylglycine-generating enzyme required for sulfatase activity